MDDAGRDAAIARLMADNVALQALAMQLMAEMAVGRDDPADWAMGFIERTHRQMDRAEASMGEGGATLFEPARTRIDVMGGQLLRALREHRGR